MKRERISKLTIFLVFVLCLQVFAVSTIEQFGAGKIDWDGGVVKAIGQGVRPPGLPEGQARVMARRAAIAEGYRNLAEIVYGVRVDSETTVNNFVTESDVIKTKVSGLIKGAKILSDKILPDGTYQVVMAINLYGVEESVANAVLPSAIENEKEQCEKKGIEVVQLPPPPEEPVVGSYTGLILDATGLGAKPAMSPKIISSDGEVIYGTLNISPDVAIEKGIIGYAHDMRKAKNSWRAGDKPLIVKGVTKSGPMKADVTVRNSDAKLILEANKKAGFLQNLRVMIVL